MPGSNPTRSDEAVPPYVDTTKPSIARVYDAFLGGKDNYEVDRVILREVEKFAPEAAQLGRDNRNFHIRAARFIASQTGITQFLDCGSGLPTAENTHQVVQRLQPEAHVVYVDNDPIVLAHGRALLEENDQSHFTAANIFEPSEVLNDDVVRKYLDFSQPIALIHASTLHHYVGERDPADIMREYIEALPSGSYVVLSHFLDPETTEHSQLARRLEHVFVNSPVGSGVFRTRAHIESMFAGLELIEPGLTLCADWWPDGPRIKPLNEVSHCIVGAVARKP
jgi:hypothetical protein